MKLKDILPEQPVKRIMVRTYGPDGEDMLFGYCMWTGRNLISLDGDSYSIEEEIVKYVFDEYGLIYWFESEWIGGNNERTG